LNIFQSDVDTRPVSCLLKFFKAPSLRIGAYDDLSRPFLGFGNNELWSAAGNQNKNDYDTKTYFHHVELPPDFSVPQTRSIDRRRLNNSLAVLEFKRKASRLEISLASKVM
jgi:hypothetical protein